MFLVILFVIFWVTNCVSCDSINQVSKIEPFEETLLQLEKMSENMQQKYRSIGIMDDFSNIVTNMITSLQEVQEKGENMVEKIKTQEEKLATVVKDIESKEDYVKQVHFEMKQIDQINNRIKAELEKTKAEKNTAQKDLMAALKQKKIILEEIDRKKKLIEKENKKEADEIKKFRTLAEDKENIIKELRDKLEHYEYLIADANESLSNIKKEDEQDTFESVMSRFRDSQYSRYRVFIKCPDDTLNEKWESSPYENFQKPHTMYDEIVDKIDEETENYVTVKPTIKQNEIDNPQINEIEKKEKKIYKIKKRKSYIYQNLYKEKDKVNVRD